MGIYKEPPVGGESSMEESNIQCSLLCGNMGQGACSTEEATCITFQVCYWGANACFQPALFFLSLLVIY